jgi:hypothetical protein
MRKRRWLHSEINTLIENYDQCSIKELMVKLPGRNQESINNQIKRLKLAGKISGDKDEEALRRAYEQRGKDLFFTVDQAK